MLVIFIEFFKSGDLRAGVFLMDLVWSVAAIIVGTALMTILITETDQAPTFYHWYGCLILLADALLSPFNAFRTAQRNLEVGNL
jgi:prolipoprotein diacylglyceryltransferase